MDDAERLRLAKLRRSERVALGAVNAGKPVKAFAGGDISAALRDRLAACHTVRDVRGVIGERAGDNPYYDAEGRFRNAAGQASAREGEQETQEFRIIPRPDDAPPEHASLPEVERWLRTRRTESGYGFDPATGKKVWERHTDGYEVPFGPKDRHQLRGMIWTHNHPRGWRYPEDDPRRLGMSFSPHDIHSAALAGMGEVRAVSPGYTFALRPADGRTWPEPEQVSEWYTMVRDRIAAQLPGVYQSGTIDPRREIAETPHRIWSELAPVMGLQYRREVVEE